MSNPNILHQLIIIKPMKIINQFYLITLGIILLGMPISLYIKLNEPNVYTYNIAIYGDTIDTSMLAYYIDKYIYEELIPYERTIRFNITLISTPETNSTLKENNGDLSKNVYSFCGVERQWMMLVEKTNLKYYIKEYGVYFGQTIQGVDKNYFKIYSTQSSVLNSMVQYGLSNFAAYNFFQKFAKSINSTQKVKEETKRAQMQDLTTASIIKSYFPNSIEEDSMKYFSVNLGLDQKYINQFILPVIYGNYLHQANSLSTLYKLLPVYCHKNPAIGKSLAIFQQPQKIKQKILSRIKTAKLNLLPNKVLQTYSIIKDKQNEKKKYVNVILNYKNIEQDETQPQRQKFQNDTARAYIKSDVLFIFDDYDSFSSTKQYSYYKTIIDGKIKNDQNYQQFFTIYLKQNPKKRQEAGKQQAKKQKLQTKPPVKSSINQIYSITRVCANNCKGFQNSIYILISKHRLHNSKQLQMFESHDIKSYKKFAIQKSQMPTNKKLQQNEHVYKLYNIQSISDSYELQLNLAKQISQSLIEKIKSQYNL